MIRTIKTGRAGNENSISIMEVPAQNKRNRNSRFLIMISSFAEEAGIYLTREQLQELNENIAQTITMEINKNE